MNVKHLWSNRIIFTFGRQNLILPSHENKGYQNTIG